MKLIFIVLFLIFLIIPSASIQAVQEAAHSFASTVQRLYELERLGVNAFALARDDLYKFYSPEGRFPPERFQRVNDTLFVLKNVTAECDGSEAQIFFNK